MKIIYRPHLIRRLREREFPNNYPKKIYEQSKRRYLDTHTKHNIAIKRLKYAGKIRKLAISYDIINENVEIITIHPTDQQEIKRRVETGRWKENEKSKK